jgi:hypothetical protein
MGYSRFIYTFKKALGYEQWRTNIILLYTTYLLTNNWRNLHLNIIFSLSKCFRNTTRRPKGTEYLHYRSIPRSDINSFHFFIQLRGRKQKYHYENDIKPVFVAWQSKVISVFTSYEQSYKTENPSLQLTETLRTEDRFNEALSHLTSYKKQTLYLRI